MRPFLLPAIVLAAALTVVGCGDGESATTTPPPTTTAPTTTTTMAPTTTTAATTTTSAGPAFVVGTPSFYPPDPLPGSLGANGSGCPPESGGLPDGIWFGKLLEVSPNTARFDPQCFYFGEAAEAAAAEDGEELPSPHYLRNPEPDSLDLTIADGTIVHSIDNTQGDLFFRTFSLQEWPAQSGGYTYCPGEGCSVWLYVNGGLVTEIMEQYLP